MKRWSTNASAVLAVGAMITVTGATGATAVEVTATSVSSFSTAGWTPPSSDPSGITFIPGKGLLISDAEVEEAAPNGLGQNTNLFHSTLAGVKTSDGSTTSWSKEPTGLFYVAKTGNPWNGHLFVTDDDLKTVFDIASAGGDGLFGTADDGARTSFRTTLFENNDPEDVALDSTRNELWIAGGLSKIVSRVNPGPDGRFDTTGDNVTANFRIPQLDPTKPPSPEGMAFDPARGTIYVLDGESTAIFELARNGSVLNTIHLGDIDMQNPGGITLDPASTGTSRTFYIADRGLDPQLGRPATCPADAPPDCEEFNDGVVHKVQVDMPAPGNVPPMANAGVDQMLDLGETVTLTGAGEDVEAGALTFEWTATGPGTATIASPTASTTTATFSAAGDYTFTLTVTDSAGASASDTAVVRVFNPGDARNIAIPIAHSSDDAIEGGGTSGKFVDVTSPDNEIGNDGTPADNPDKVLTGLRFANLPVPKGAEIISAKIQFKVDEGGSLPASFVVEGEAADNAAPYLAVSGNISARPRTTATVPWSPEAWPAPSLTGGGLSGPDQLTTELKSILQEIVNRPGWARGNAAAFVISGTPENTGRRTAEAKDGLTPPVLMLEFKTAVANSAPVVDAGADLAVTMPAAANLDGTVTDDGKPAPYTVKWSKVSGPGTVTFANDAAEDTTATFSAAGDYTLRLTANDSALTGQDDVVVKVAAATSGGGGTGGGGGGGGGGTTNAAPSVSVGADQSVTVGTQLGLDATVTDDGQPAPYTVKWTKVSGPGAVTFGNAAAVDTTASFSQVGSYTIRLTADDSALTDSDDMVVTVNDGEQAVTVSLSGPQRKLEFGQTARLRGSLEIGGASADGELVRIFVKRGKGIPFRFLGNVATEADGSFVFSDRPSARSVYMARSNGERSERVVVRVMPRLRAWVTDETVDRRERTAIRGWISPAHEGQRLRLQQWTGSRWRVVRTMVLPDGDRVRFSFGIRHRSAGTKKYRVVSPAYAGMARAVAPDGNLRIQVRRAG